MATKWNSKIQFPSDSNFKNRIIGGKYAPSGAGNPMLTLDLELVEPQEVTVGEELVTIAGVKSQLWYVTTVMKDDGSGIDTEATDKCKKAFKEFIESLGMDSSTIDMNNVDPKAFLNKLIFTQMTSDVVKQTKNPTTEQINKGIKEGKRLNQIKGEVMKHPVTGKELVDYWPKVVQVFCAVPGQ